MGESKHCHFCEKKLTWYRWSYECEDCGELFCLSHVNSVKEIELESQKYGKNVFLCFLCDMTRKSDYERAKEVKVVRSSHVGGHKLLETLKDISTGIQYKDFDNAKFELQYNAYKLGGNAILNYRYVKHKHQKPTGHEGRGTYYYNLFTAKGTVAKIEKLDRR